MNRAEHIRQVLAVAKSHVQISEQMLDAHFEACDRGVDFSRKLRADNPLLWPFTAGDGGETCMVAYSHQVIAQQMADDQARCEAFAVAFWHRVFHRNLREHGER